HPRIRWTKRGLSCVDRSGLTVPVDERGLVLMPTAFHGPKVAAIVDEPWLPTIAYPARGTGDLWRSPGGSPEALARLLGRTRPPPGRAGRRRSAPRAAPSRCRRRPSRR